MDSTTRSTVLVFLTCFSPNPRVALSRSLFQRDSCLAFYRNLPEILLYGTACLVRERITKPRRRTFLSRYSCVTPRSHENFYSVENGNPTGGPQSKCHRNHEIACKRWNARVKRRQSGVIFGLSHRAHEEGTPGCKERLPSRRRET